MDEKTKQFFLSSWIHDHSARSRLFPLGRALAELQIHADQITAYVSPLLFGLFLRSPGGKYLEGNPPDVSAMFRDGNSDERQIADRDQSLRAFRLCDRN